MVKMTTPDCAENVCYRRKWGSNEMSPFTLKLYIFSNEVNVVWKCNASTTIRNRFYWTSIYLEKFWNLSHHVVSRRNMSLHNKFKAIFSLNTDFNFTLKITAVFLNDGWVNYHRPTKRKRSWYKTDHFSGQ